MTNPTSVVYISTEGLD